MSCTRSTAISSLGYADGGDAPDKELPLVPGAAEDAERFLAQHAETRARFERVADLVEGFETPFGLELLSTVDWVVAREGAQSENEVIRRVYAWNERKRRFSPRQIALARDVLARKGTSPSFRERPASRCPRRLPTQQARGNGTNINNPGLMRGRCNGASLRNC